MARVTAVFDNQTRAEQAVIELRRLGVTDTDLSFVARSEEEAVAAGASPDSAGKRAAKGAAAGAGAGLLFGLAALAIPGVGPFVTAGALASALRSEEHTSELQSPCNLVCRLLLEKKKKTSIDSTLT